LILPVFEWRTNRASKYPVFFNAVWHGLKAI